MTFSAPKTKMNFGSPHTLASSYAVVAVYVKYNKINAKCMMKYILK